MKTLNYNKILNMTLLIYTASAWICFMLLNTSILWAISGNIVQIILLINIINKTKQMKNELLWWGYVHANGSYQVKRYFGQRDITEAEESPFVDTVSDPFFARDRDHALEIIKQLYDNN